CGCSLDRDHNAAINIKNRAVGHPVFKAQSMSEAIAGVAQKPTLYCTQLA
ncbi:transposase, partial [Microcoleus sp. A6-D4]